MVQRVTEKTLKSFKTLTIWVGPDSDSVKADFLKESKRVLRRL